MIEKNPDLVRRVAIGVARVGGGAKDREAAIAAVTKRDRLLKPDTERARMELGDRQLIRRRPSRSTASEHVSAERMSKESTVFKEGFQLPALPDLEQSL